jgi:hypothetical protein
MARVDKRPGSITWSGILGFIPLTTKGLCAMQEPIFVGIRTENIIMNSMRSPSDPKRCLR